jgi:hypothetical protein
MQRYNYAHAHSHSYRWLASWRRSRRRARRLETARGRAPPGQFPGERARCYRFPTRRRDGHLFHLRCSRPACADHRFSGPATLAPETSVTCHKCGHACTIKTAIETALASYCESQSQRSLDLWEEMWVSGKRRLLDYNAGTANFAFVEPEREYGPAPFGLHSACTIC